jgi:uncharacterized cupin superfamily protein
LDVVAGSVPSNCPLLRQQRRRASARTVRARIVAPEFSICGGCRRRLCRLDYCARMEPYPGVFVSNLSASAWEPDPDVGGEMHVLCGGHGAESGLSRFTAAEQPISWTLPGRETLLVLEGAARIEIEGGPVLELVAGDIASLPAGARTTWYLTTPFKEFWVIS